MNEREFGIVGLGRIGGGLALQAVDKGGLRRELVDAGVREGQSFGAFRERLERPRAVFVYVPAGPVVDAVLDELAETLEPGDVIVDGGNSYWGDSIRRHRRLKQKDVHLLDLGTSGGVHGARNGACFMLGGEPDPVARVEPVLRELAVEGGYVHAGPPGTGHFVKLVHNGIEFGMLQAIGEGIDLLEHHREDLPVADVLRCWRHGSVIRSWLVDLMESEYRDRSGLAGIPPHVEDTGEVSWLVADALRMERPIPVIAQAVMQLFASRDESKEWARAIAQMRHGFGGHPYGEDETIRKERQAARVGPIWRETDQEHSDD